MGWKESPVNDPLPKGPRERWGGREEEFPAEKVAQAGALKERRELSAQKEQSLAGRG